MSDLIERYQNLVKSGFEYASSDKGSAPTSTFEIYVGHFKDIGVELCALIAALEKENAELRAERDLLQDVLDGRPAINAGLPETYIRWSQSVYSGDIIRASLSSSGKGVKP